MTAAFLMNGAQYICSIGVLAIAWGDGCREWILSEVWGTRWRVGYHNERV